MKRELEQIRKRIDNLLSESRSLYMEMASLTCTLEDLDVIDNDRCLHGSHRMSNCSDCYEEMLEGERLKQNWENMEEATKKAALKRARDIMKKDIQAEKIRQDMLQDEPEFYEAHEENGTPRTLYEE